MGQKKKIFILGKKNQQLTDKYLSYMLFYSINWCYK
jgi:hypothetical protein